MAVAAVPNAATQHSPARGADAASRLHPPRAPPGRRSRPAASRHATATPAASAVFPAPIPAGSPCGPQAAGCGGGDTLPATVSSGHRCGQLGRLPGSHGCRELQREGLLALSRQDYNAKHGRIHLVAGDEGDDGGGGGSIGTSRVPASATVQRRPHALVDVIHQLSATAAAVRRRARPHRGSAPRRGREGQRPDLDWRVIPRRTISLTALPQAVKEAWGGGRASM